MTPREMSTAEIDTISNLINKDISSPLGGGKTRVHGSLKHAYLGNDLERFDVQYLNQDGGFTICIFRLRKGNLMWIGASRKSKNDKPNRVRGEMMAFMRAIRHSSVGM